MSNHVMQSCHERKESGEQSTHAYQSVWMAHWGRTGKAASRAQNRLAVDHKSIGGNPLPPIKQLPDPTAPDAAADASNCGSKEFMELPVAGPTNVPDVISQFSKKERLEHDRPFPMFSLSKNQNKSMLTLKDDRTCFFNSQAVGPQGDLQSGPTASPGEFVKGEKVSMWAPSVYETEAQEDHLDLGGTTQHFVEKNSLVVSASFKDDLFTPSSRYPVGHTTSGLEKVNECSSFLTAKGRFMNTSLSKLEPGQCNYHSSSAVFVHQQDNDPSMRKNQLEFFFGNDEYLKSLKDFRTRFFQSQASPFEVKEAECSSRPRNSLVDVETMRICTTIDSVAGSKFHRTMKELFFSEKKTNANLSREGTMLRESRVSSTTQIKGNTNNFTELLGLSRGGGVSSHQQGVKLQPLWSSTDGEEKDNAVDLKNESSAETNTMDIDALKDDHHCGGGLSLLNKNSVGFRKLLASRAAAEIMSEEGSGRENADLPCPNWNYLALPSAISSSAGDEEPSMSKTQSLDAAHLLPDVDVHMATNSKSKSTQSEPDPGSRWVKRLKVGASEPFNAGGTEISKTEEATSSLDLFGHSRGRMIKRRVTSPQPLTSDRSSEKKPILSDQNEPLIMKDSGSYSMSESIGKNRSKLLSHSWIRRWCRGCLQAQKKVPEGEEVAFVFCEPQSLKAPLEIEKKHFPSLAAMALMGKAMNGFHPCEFKRRGSFVVWNTNGQ